MLETLLRILKIFIPKKIFAKLQPAYHWALALLSAVMYRFPARDIFVVGVTGTKGKTSTVELVNAILEEAGHKTALLGTLRFKIGDKIEPNKKKMTMPGRFFIQKLLRDAVKEGCTYAVIEMTSEGVKQSRHKFLNLDALIFTNLSPEHIESHGSYENYVAAKLAIAKELEASPKAKKTIIANTDDEQGKNFLAINVPNKIAYGLSDASDITQEKHTTTFKVGKDVFNTQLEGTFNIYNALGAIAFAKTQKIPVVAIQKALINISSIPGRMEYINEGQDFSVVVDYAHTADSLRQVYETFASQKKICVLGSAGGGRDTWKRKEMGSVADGYCAEIILTDEDPYDEDPREIVRQVAEGISGAAPRIIMDRREAIRTALELAKKGDAVLITGKGTDPFIMEADGKKTPWSDADVTREELKKI